MKVYTTAFILTHFNLRHVLGDVLRVAHWNRSAL